MYCVRAWRIQAGIAPHRKWTRAKKFVARHSLWPTPADFAEQVRTVGDSVGFAELCRILAKHYGKQTPTIQTKLRELALCPVDTKLTIENAYPDIRTLVLDMTGGEMARHYGVSRQRIAQVLAKLNPTIPTRKSCQELRMAKYKKVLAENPGASSEQLQALGVPMRHCPKAPNPRKEALRIRNAKITEMLQQVPQPSDRHIGETLGVGIPYVGNIRHKLGLPTKFPKMGRGNHVSKETMEQIRTMLRVPGMQNKTIAETLGISMGYVSKFKTGRDYK